MSSDLSVDTGALRATADALELVAADLSSGPDPTAPCSLTSGGLGTTPLALEVAVAAERRVRQAAEAVELLRDRIIAAGTALRAAADAFDVADADLVRPPR